MNIFVAVAMILTTILATVIAGVVTAVSAWKPKGEAENEYVYGAQNTGEPVGIVAQLTRRPKSPAMIYLQMWLAVEVSSMLVILIIAGSYGA